MRSSSSSRLASRALVFLENKNDQYRRPSRIVCKIFQGDFIERNGMSLLQLASASGIPVAEIEAIIKDERPLTDDDAERFGRVFGVSGEYFKNLYAQYAK